MRIRALKVAEVNQYLKQMMTRDPILNRIAITGELSGFKCHTSGHAYFSLKDGEAKINCVWFNAERDPVARTLRDGVQVVCEGSMTLYEREGRCQLLVRTVSVEGTGDLAEQFEALKRKLSDLGYFDPKTKKQIPFWPKRVALITSQTGAVVRDLLTVSGRRNPNIEILVIPTSVQGQGAEVQIAKAIERANLLKNIDVIILARGGGSIEELWSFNTEVVANAIYKSEIPLVSAIGHETDFTIADFVADLRAATPSEAAELVFPDLEGLREYLSINEQKFIQCMNKQLNDVKNILRLHNPEREYGKIMSVISRHTENINHLFARMSRSEVTKVKEYQERLYMTAQLLDTLSPLAVLGRGYAVATNGNREVINSVKQLVEGESLKLVLKDGEIDSLVTAIHGPKGVSYGEENSDF